MYVFKLRKRRKCEHSLSRETAQNVFHHPSRTLVKLFLKL